MATITLTLEEYEALKDMAMVPNVVEIIPAKAALAKPKRKVSKYGKEFGKQLKALKAKHPRTKVTQLMSQAHRATRKAMK